MSKRIRELRNGIKLSQAKLAEKLETKQPLLARYETGEHLPTLELLIRYADYFDVSIIDNTAKRQIVSAVLLYEFNVLTIR